MQTASFRRVLAPALFFVVAIVHPVAAQDRLPGMPGYARYQKMRGEIPGSVKRGIVTVNWEVEGKAFNYSWDGKKYRFDFITNKPTEITTVAHAPTTQRLSDPTTHGPSALQARGRQLTSATSPDGKHKAFYRDRNLWLSDADGSNEKAITTDGSVKDRIKNGTGSWVYGEELFQRTAMWWSPNSRKIAFYRFDESKVRDFYLQMKQTQLVSDADIEPYPKAGAPNPIADLLIYDVESGKTTTADVRDGKSFDDSSIGHYVYAIDWSKNGKELLFNRTNRRQNAMDYVSCDPETGACRVVVHEEWPTGWVDNRPPVRWLKDGVRFVCTSSRSGWKNYFLYDLHDGLKSTLTDNRFDAANIVRVDEDQKVLYYMARDGENPNKLQLHRVGLDGSNEKRLTDPAFNHSVDIAPDGQHFIDVYQTHDTPPATRVVDSEGKVIYELAQSDVTKFKALELQPVEVFKFKAADGKTDLYGELEKPSGFDPNKKYPLLVSVYAGPETNGASENFHTPNPMTELGFLHATFDSRSASGRGKKVLDSIYQKLGITEIDDQAEGVKFLRQRSYVDGGRVGIYGTSYGGYASAMCLLRYPDVFQAASASSPVTDWKQYDSIYTERYMWIPQENSSGYDAGSAMTYAKNLRGRLLLYYGTADNNVHPNNSMQLISALQRAGKSFDVQVGPDQGHSGLRFERMMEFFIENLVIHPESLLAPH